LPRSKEQSPPFIASQRRRRLSLYGFYWLRIASGDIVDVDTLLTNTPRGLERAGVKPEDVLQSLRNVVDTVADKGPGGHILTGPVYVEGAEPGDPLFR
jgi:acetamidase/formamidase